MLRKSINLKNETTQSKETSDTNSFNKIKIPKKKANKKTYFDKLNKDSLGSIREGFGKGLLEAAKQNKNIVALCADLTNSLKVNYFSEKYPKRFFQFGIAEQNMMSAAAGMCINGKIPFVVSYGAFNPGRNWDQLRVSVCYQKSNVKIIGGHCGLTTGPDGATHQMLEDIAITRVLPNLNVIVPCDEEEAKKATLEITKTNNPCYLRLTREKSLNITNEKTKFEIGKAIVLDEGSDLTIIACGICVQFALEAKKELLKYDIDAAIINMHTLKPLDEKTLLKYAKKTKHFITIEEHQKAGGMGSAISEFLSQNYPIPISIIGVEDRFGESGDGYELLKKYKISVEEIVKKTKNIINN